MSQAEIAFDALLARAQDLPEASVPYFLAMVEPEANAVYGRLAEAIAVSMGAKLPADAVPVRRYFEAVRANDRFRIIPLTKWLNEETKSIMPVLEALNPAIDTAALLASLSSTTGQEADNRAGVLT